MPKGYPKNGVNNGQFKKGVMSSPKPFTKGHPTWNKNRADIYSDETLEKMRITKLGKPLSEEHRKKLGLKKENHPSWKGIEGGCRSPEYRRRVRKKELEELAGRCKPEQCEICREFAGTGKKGIHFDHNHTTGKFRGWICMRCNLTLGLVKDNKELLQAMINYLN